MLPSIARLNAPYVFAMQLCFFVASCIGIFVVDWTIPSFIVFALFYFIYGGFLNSVILHRCLSHRNPLAKPFVYVGSYLTSWSLIGPPLGYVAIHRAHHMAADTEKDPHSPLFKSGREIFCEIFFVKANPVLIRDLLQDRFLVFLSQNYLLISVSSLLALLWALGPQWFLMAVALPASCSYLTATSVNYFCHKVGSRPNATNDRSTNLWWLGVLVFGEGWHNNHHSQPQNPYFGRSWAEFDLGGLTFLVLRKLGGQ